MIQKGPTYMYRKNIHVDTPVSPFILYMLAISEVWIYSPAIKHCNSNCGALRRQSASSACHTISNRQLEKAHFQFLELGGFWINEAVSGTVYVCKTSITLYKTSSGLSTIAPLFQVQVLLYSSPQNAGKCYLWTNQTWSWKCSFNIRAVMDSPKKDLVYFSKLLPQHQKVGCKS